MPIGGHILRWKAGVTTVKSPAMSMADTTSSARHPPPSMPSFTTHSSSVTSFSGRQELQVPSNIPEQDDLSDMFSDDVDDEDEHAHTVGNQMSEHGKKVVVVSGSLCVNNITYLVARSVLHQSTVTLNYLMRPCSPAHMWKAPAPQAPAQGSKKLTNMNLTVGPRNSTL